MHMLPIPTGMHMHPMLRIRFDPVAPIPAPMARGWIGTKRTEADIGAGAWREGRLWIQKTPGVQRRQASRFLALCLTWRQEAANHHDIDCARQSRLRSRPRQGLRAPIVQSAANCATEYEARLTPGSRRCRGRTIVTSASVWKVVSRVPGALFQRSGDTRLRVTFVHVPRPRGRTRRRIHSFIAAANSSLPAARSHLFPTVT